MNTSKPTYYDQFHCTASACTFTCCRDWDISVDPATQDRWKALGMNPKEYLRPGLGGDCMKLQKDGRCIFLQEDGLCKQVIDHGEGSLSLTCHLFPRETHTFGNLTEYTLTMGCPEALRLLWEQDSFAINCDTPSPLKTLVEAQPHKIFDDANPALLAFRQKLIDLVQNPNDTLEEALRIGFLLVTDFYDRYECLDNVSTQNISSNLTIETIEQAFASQNLKAIQTAISQINRDFYEHIMEQNELFLDLVENYRKKGIYTTLIAPLAAVMEEYENPDLEDDFCRDRAAFEGVWAARERQLRLLFAEEIFSTLYLPGGNFYTAILKLEWLGIFYAALKQGLFVRWKLDGQLTDAAFDQLIVLLIRITGYSEDDIEEYLEDSFEEVIWDWGYFALIV